MLNWIKNIRIMYFDVNSIRCKCMKGTIFDIKEFTVHDGPGSRVTVFLKGCPLRCQWCHNPEGLSTKKQILYKSTLCVQCGRCRVPCAHEECKGLERCVHACANGCLTISGEEYEEEQLAEKLLKNAQILQMMGGGVTFSGGEPLLQAGFVCAVAERLENVHKALQTSGYASHEDYIRTVDHMDYVLQDMKLADPAEHKKYTGVDNGKILRNIAWLKASGKEFVFRVPLIPGITDTEKNLMALAEIAENHPVELMPYNPFAGAKYAMVGMEYSIRNEENRAEDFTKYFQNAVILA